MTDINSEGEEQGTGEPQAAIPAEAPGAIPERKFDAQDVADHKYMAALSYIGILFLVPMLLKRESAFSQFHAKQGLVLAVIFFVGSFVFWIPLIGWAAFLFVLVVDVMALLRTLQGEAWEIPIVKDIVKKLNI